MSGAYMGKSRGDEGIIVAYVASSPEAKGETWNHVRQAGTGGFELGEECVRVAAKGENKLCLPRAPTDSEANFLVNGRSNRECHCHSIYVK